MVDISRRNLFIASTVTTFAGVAVAATSQATGKYDPAGVYLDYDTRSDIGRMSNVRFDEKGIIQVARGDQWVYNPVTISQYGLQQFGYHVKSGERAPLANALQQAGWLFTNQDRVTGLWKYDYAFGVGAMSETLPAGWGSAMAQGQAISLLTRIARKYPSSPNYLAAANRALRPLTVEVSAGGLRSELDGHPHYEEYPTRSAGCFALNGFQFCLTGLHDMRSMGSSLAESLYSDGVKTLRYQLPKHDAVGTTAYHLGHITKPYRAIHNADHYHRIHVMLLDTMNTFDPSPATEFYSNLWRTYPPMNNSSRTLSKAVDPLIGAGIDSNF